MALNIWPLNIKKKKEDAKKHKKKILIGWLVPTSILLIGGGTAAGILLTSRQKKEFSIEFVRIFSSGGNTTTQRINKISLNQKNSSMIVNGYTVEFETTGYVGGKDYDYEKSSIYFSILENGVRYNHFSASNNFIVSYDMIAVGYSINIFKELSVKVAETNNTFGQYYLVWSFEMNYSKAVNDLLGQIYIINKLSGAKTINLSVK